jgi:hypothetical protein
MSPSLACCHFLRSVERLNQLRLKFTVKQLFSIVRAGLVMLGSEDFARACTAVTQNMSEHQIRCIRHVYIDRLGTIKSHGSSLTDEHVQSMLRENKVQPVYIFVIVNVGEGSLCFCVCLCLCNK